jgi:xanthine/uracil permease
MSAMRLFRAADAVQVGLRVQRAIVIGMCLMAVVSAIETVGDTSASPRAAPGREATDKEIEGATFADGLGTAIAGVFGGLPNTSFSRMSA